MTPILNKCAEMLSMGTCEGIFANFITHALIFIVFTMIVGAIIYFVRRYRSYFSSIYISTSMSIVDDARFNSKKLFINRIDQSLSISNSVFHGFKGINSRSEYKNDEQTLAGIILRIKSCRYFIIILDEREFSSALIELGLAIAFNKNIIVLHKKNSKMPIMPYLIANLQNYSVRRLRIRKIEFQSLEVLANEIESDPIGWLKCVPR